MPSSLQPKVWWILIGTNDLASGCSAEAVMVGIISIVQEIQKQRPSALIVVNSILPRPGDNTGLLGGQLWQDIVWVNDRMECFSQGVDRVEYFNATELFLTPAGTHINQTLLPDWLHPSVAGSQVWGTEIVKRVKELVS